MSESFKVSDDFAAFEAETSTAVQEAAKSEKRTMGINLPMGTRGTASIVSIDWGKSSIKTDPTTKQQTGGHPMCTITSMVNTPAEYAGQKAMTYRTINQTAKRTIAQAWAALYDTLMDMGMTKEMRNAAPKSADINKWAAQEPRSFNYEIVQQFGSAPGTKEFRPCGVTNTQLPDATDIQAALASFTQDEKVKVAGNEATVVTPAVTNGKIKVKFASGQEMEVPVDNVTKA